METNHYIFGSSTTTRNIPHKCPVCDGSGKYKRKACHACDGTGIVWGTETETVGAPYVPYLPYEPYGPYYPNYPLWGDGTLKIEWDDGHYNLCGSNDNEFLYESTSH